MVTPSATRPMAATRWAGVRWLRAPASSASPHRPQFLSDSYIASRSAGVGVAGAAGAAAMLAALHRRAGAIPTTTGGTNGQVRRKGRAGDRRGGRDRPGLGPRL